MNNSIYKELEVPFFPGFYESILESSDTEYYEIKEKIEFLKENPNKNWDTIPSENDFIFNYEQRHFDIANEYCKAVGKWAPNYVLDIEYSTIESPQSYNYTTDRLFAIFELDNNWKEQMKQFMNQYHEWLAQKINEEWSNKNGFTSLIDNNIDTWQLKIFQEEDARYISIMIGYQMLLDGNKYEHDFDKELYRELAYEALNNIDDKNYLSISKEWLRDHQKYRSVHELTNDELEELANAYYCQLLESGKLNEIDPEGKCNLATGMPLDMTISHYEGTSFVKDDFFTNQKD